MYIIHVDTEGEDRIDLKDCFLFSSFRFATLFIALQATTPSAESTIE